VHLGRPNDPVAAKGGRRWNHNIHYHRRILGAIPENAQRALDVGCGEGMLARDDGQCRPCCS